MAALSDRHEAGEKEDLDWSVDKVYIKDHHIRRLPASPVCPSLEKLFLRAPRLAVIPPTFFQHMPLLKVLDLSDSNIMSLTPFISSLTSLEEFILKDCSTIAELPPDIGMLTNLKLFDIQGTEVPYLPKEMAYLKQLQVLRVTMSPFALHCLKTTTAFDNVIPRKLISQLKNLKELSIFVSSQVLWWEEEMKDIQNELCDLEKLETLRWCLPTTESLQQFLLLETRNHSPLYTNLSSLMITVGQFPHIVSFMPRKLEEKFEEFKSFLKWLDAEGRMDDISKIVASVEGLFLAQNSIIEKLSVFDLTKLKYCVVGRCCEMETLVEAPPSGEKVGFESLQYLSVHFMEKLHSIWKGPVGEDSFSKLTVLALNYCPELTSIFTPAMAQNFSCLIELSVQDCSKVRSLVSTESHQVEFVCGILFPSLERLFLIDLPELEKIFGCGVIVEELDTLLIYCCPKLRSLDINELPHVKKIEGESYWWEDLDCDKSEWEEIFVLLSEDDMITRVFEAEDSLHRFVDSIPHGLEEKFSSNRALELEVKETVDHVILEDANSKPEKDIIQFEEHCVRTTCLPHVQPSEPFYNVGVYHWGVV